MTAGTDRLHALDAVRAFALLLGIVLHATMSFFLPVPALDSSQSVTLGVVFYVIHIFRMSAFYLIAGFFARMVLERKGFEAFAKDRAKRILIPMFGSYIPLFVLTLPIIIVGLLLTVDTEVLNSAPEDEGGIPLLHLWFLYYLAIFYIVALGLRWLFRNVLDRSGAIRRLVDVVIRFLLRGYVGPILFAAPLAYVLYNDPDWMAWLGVPTPEVVGLQLSAFAGFGVAFGVGWIIHRQIGMINEWQKRWIGNLIIAVVLTAASLNIVGLSPGNVLDPDALSAMTTVPGPEWARAVYVVCYTLAIWYWTFGIIGAALQYFSEPNQTIRYIADSSYWLYLAHLPLVYLFAVALALVPIHWSIKFALILGASMWLLLLTYKYWVRNTWLGALLNGRRRK